jgi:cobalt-zinc-cadmium resistance protein CzcA
VFRENRLVSKLKLPYHSLLVKTLQVPWLVITLAVIAVVLSFSLFDKLGEEFVPTLDEKDIAMHAMRIPSTSLTQSTEMQIEVERALKQLPEVAYVYSKTGTAEMASDPMPPNVSDTFIILHPKEEWPDPSLSKEQLIEKIQEAVTQLPGNHYEFTQPIEMRFNELISGVRSDLAIKVYGDNFDKMQQTAQEIAKALNAIPGAADVKVEQVDGLPILNIQIDREKTSLHKLNVSDALDTISFAIGGGKAGQIFEGDRRFDLIVKLPDAIREDFDTLHRLPIPLPHERHAHTPPILLGEIAHLNIANGLNEISRENGKRFVSIEANIRGTDLGSFVKMAKKEIDEKVFIPDGYWLTWGGQFENLMSARNRLLLVVPLCFGLIFILLYTAFNSFKNALLVFTSVPFALTGGILSLWLRNMPFSITAAVGFIALSGIAVLNGLVLVTSINQLRQEGNELTEAIMQGALTRFRPVLMTALAASLGFIPMALATGTGAEVQKPLATVVIGGLVSSTLLTLLVLPALYQLFSNPFYFMPDFLLIPQPVKVKEK